MMQAFNKAATWPPELSSFDFVEAVLRERPDLRGQEQSFPPQGSYGHVVFIGDEVFKGPRSEFCVAKFEKELDFLKDLQGKGLLIPNVTCEGEDTFFYGMTRVPGVSLETVEKALTKEQWRLLASDITDFIIGMAQALPQSGGKYARHNDMHFDNILVDPETKRLTGIIDFGMVNYRPERRLGQFRYWHTLFRMVRQEYKKRRSQCAGGSVVWPARSGMRMKP